MVEVREPVLNSSVSCFVKAGTSPCDSPVPCQRSPLLCITDRTNKEEWVETEFLGTSA